MALHQRLGVLQDNVSKTSLHINCCVKCLHLPIYRFLDMELSLFNSLCYVVIRERTAAVLVHGVFFMVHISYVMYI